MQEVTASDGTLVWAG
ncbi:TPA: hypothetical protein ACIDD6_004279 [Shigella flexneri]|nr:MULTISPECIES: hypothetical protein [Enterobacteriaceae]WNE50300.1 hypothetical protein NKG74_22020 [Shigella flexneri]